MHGAFRRGLFASTLLGAVALLSAIACSSGQEPASTRDPLVKDTKDTRRSEWSGLAGRATLPFSSNGKALVPIVTAKGDAAVTLGLAMELPIRAAGAVKLRAGESPEHALALTPVRASGVQAAISKDGSAVYAGAFGNADLTQSATLDGLHTRIAIRDAGSPDVFVWQTELGQGLTALVREDGATDFVDAEGKAWLSASTATLTDGHGVSSKLPLLFDGDGFARLRVDHRELAYPAQLDFSISLGPMQALAIAPTLIKGRVMVLLDTSGSMIWQFGSATGTHGDSPRDGRTLFCDNALNNGSGYACNSNVACTAANGALSYFQVDDSAQPSRMLASKLAMQNVINAYSGLLEFGLERYAENSACPNPTYCCTTRADGTTKGRCGDVGEYTDIPPTNDDFDLTYSGSCGSATVGGRVLVSPGPTSGAQFLPWVDFVEDFCSSTAAAGGAPRNPELRGNGSTPLARAIITARESWYKPIYNDSRQAGVQPLDDSLIDCRPYVFVVMTDGDDTCSTGPYDCQGNSANCAAGMRCVDVNRANGGGEQTWRCACSTTADCGAATDDCVADTEITDCNNVDAQCASNDCVNTRATNGDNNAYRCACASSADCGAGLECVTNNAPLVNCGGDDSQCLSGDCFDLPNTAGTNWRCACADNTQCPATQQCTNGRCVTRGVCRTVGRCDRFTEPRPRAQVQNLTDVNTTNPVKTYVLGMGNPAGLNQTELNAMAVNGGTAPARLASSQQEIEAAFADIVANTVKYEICNTADDNCNARIDEGLGVYQECLTATDCNGGACNSGRCVCNGDAQCGMGYSCSNEAPTRFCRPSCSEGQGACFAAGVRKCGVGVGQCCVNNNSATCTDIVPPAGTAEVCNGIDDNCNGFIDENLPCSGCVPLPEVCDGADNDCDGNIDELDNPNTPGNDGLVDVGGVCGSNIGRCTPGTATCVSGKLECSGATGPFTEVCNGYDDDCDGVTDGMSRDCYPFIPPTTEGVGACHAGLEKCNVTTPGTPKWDECSGEVGPMVEVCNGVDDDCDGEIDEGVVGPGGETLGALCCGINADMNQCGQGQCEKGTYQCVGSVLACVGAVNPSNELCDGVDNDCNGDVDDIPNLGGACEAPGGCGGTLQCDSAAQMLVCVPDGMTALEVCNGLDDDCDGQTDETDDIMVNEPWWHDPCNEPPPGHDQPPCGPGMYVCKNGEQVCEGGLQPLDHEVCDLKDNDCDGIGDPLAACPGTNACVQGVCVEPCHGGEFPCPGGYECDSFDGKKYCVPTTCNDVECPPGASCLDGKCTLDNQGGAGNTPGEGGAGNQPNPGEGGAGNAPGEGGAADDAGAPNGGTSGSGTTAGSSTGNQPGEGDDGRGVYGLVTGGGGCACHTAPLGGGKWALAGSLLALGMALSRRRRAQKGRAA